MRWFGGGFFLLVAIGFSLFSLVLFSAHGDSDTARSVVVGAGVVFASLAVGALVGSIWTFRRLGPTARAGRLLAADA